MPDIPELAEVNAVLKNYMIFSGRQDAFPLQLKQYLAGIKHDNMEVCKQVKHFTLLYVGQLGFGQQYVDRMRMHS